MRQSDLNHLRRLLGWIRCDIGQAPAELQQTMIDIAASLGHQEISPDAKARMVESYRRAEAVPLYVRAAVKALEKVLAGAGRHEPPAAGAGRHRGATEPRATSETRASIGFDPGVDAGREPVANTQNEADAQAAIEALRAIVAECCGPGRPYDGDSYLPSQFLDAARAALASAEYAPRLLRGRQQSLAAEHGENETNAAAEALQNHLNAATSPVACHDIPAKPPPFAGMAPATWARPAGVSGLIAVNAASQFA